MRETLIPKSPLFAEIILIGAGKSTLIKLLVEVSASLWLINPGVVLFACQIEQLYNPDRESYQTPVVGSIKHDHIPTSGDVHLYADPQTFRTAKPVLYADCEGLQGGEREPKGARSRISSASKVRQRFCQLYQASDREITWATTSEKRSRQFAVAYLYPRLLYTFSDVVVFVLKNPK